MTDLPVATDHLALETGGKHKCPCGEAASRLARCPNPKCRAVVARCGNPKCGDVSAARAAHCAKVTP